MNDKQEKLQKSHEDRLLRTRWGEKPYYSLDYYLKETFGKKVYKLALDGGMTCPNRDGTLGTGGCIFCSEGGSGDFAEGSSVCSAAPGCAASLALRRVSPAFPEIEQKIALLNVHRQIERARERVSSK